MATRLKVNDKISTVDAPPDTPLLYVLAGDGATLASPNASSEDFA